MSVENNKEDVWLNPDFLHWEYRCQCRSDLKSEFISFPHKLLEHATAIISAEHNELHLGDVVSNLKRAVFHRLETLDSVYMLQQLEKISVLDPLKRSASNIVEIMNRLSQCGFVRPLMIEKLRLLRNDIEHEYIEATCFARV